MMPKSLRQIYGYGIEIGAAIGNNVVRVEGQKHGRHTMKHTANGTRIYYRGDMANRDGFGTVTAQFPSDRFADQIEITMDDGRVISIPDGMVKTQDTGNGLTRFVTYEAYMERRTAEFKAYGLI
jgi:hypothetical protein